MRQTPFFVAQMVLGLAVLAIVAVAIASKPPAGSTFLEGSLKMWEVDGDLNVVLVWPEDGTVIVEFVIFKETVAIYQAQRGVDSTEMALAELKKAVLEYRAKKGKP